MRTPARHRKTKTSPGAKLMSRLHAKLANRFPFSGEMRERAGVQLLTPESPVLLPFSRNKTIIQRAGIVKCSPSLVLGVEILAQRILTRMAVRYLSILGLKGKKITRNTVRAAGYSVYGFWPEVLGSKIKKSKAPDTKEGGSDKGEKPAKGKGKDKGKAKSAAAEGDVGFGDFS